MLCTRWRNDKADLYKLKLLKTTRLYSSSSSSSVADVVVLLFLVARREEDEEDERHLGYRFSFVSFHTRPYIISLPAAFHPAAVQHPRSSPLTHTHSLFFLSKRGQIQFILFFSLSSYCKIDDAQQRVNAISLPLSHHQVLKTRSLLRYPSFRTIRPHGVSAIMKNGNGTVTCLQSGGPAIINNKNCVRLENAGKIK